MRLIGYKHLTGKTQDGKDFSGCRLYCAGSDENTVGYFTQDFYLSDKKCSEYNFDDMLKNKTEFRIAYNQYRKPDFLVFDK